MNDRLLLREPELSERTGMPARTLRMWRKMRIIPYHKIGNVVLYDPVKVMAALDRFERNKEAANN